jgi:hypothetical protein
MVVLKHANYRALMGLRMRPSTIQSSGFGTMVVPLERRPWSPTSLITPRDSRQEWFRDEHVAAVECGSMLGQWNVVPWLNSLAPVGVLSSQRWIGRSRIYVCLEWDMLLSCGSGSMSYACWGISPTGLADDRVSLAGPCRVIPRRPSRETETLCAELLCKQAHHLKCGIVNL